MRTSFDFHTAAYATAPTYPEPVVASTLDVAARRQLAHALSTAIAGSLLPSTRHRALIDGLADSFASSQLERPESRTILAVDGAFGVGKTSAILDWAYRLHRESAGDIQRGERQPGRPLRGGGRCDDVPVVWLGLKGGQDSAGISLKMLHYFRHGNRGNQQQREIAVGEAIEAHRPRLLVVDDAHMLNTRLIKGRHTLDSIKGLNDMLSNVGGTMLLVGQGLIGGELLTDPQLAARLETPYSLSAYQVDTKEEIAEWQRLIKACEDLIRTYIDPDDEHPLLTHAQQLWKLSRGHVRDLSRLLAAATASCINDGRSKLAAADFDRVRPLVRTEQAEKRAAIHAARQAKRNTRAS